MFQKKSSKNYNKKNVSSDKHIAAIARKVVQNAPETKIMNFASQIFTTDSLVYAHNLSSRLVAGSTNFDIVGQKAFIKNFYIKLRAMRSGTLNAQSTVFRFLVVRSVAKWTTTYGTIANSEVFTSATHQGLCHVDFDKVHLLSDKTVTLDTDWSGQTPSRIIDIKIPINKSMTYESSATSYGRDYNYYLIVTSQDYSLGGTGNVIINTSCSFTDA